jgi:virulence-associated protein VagC
MSISSVFKHNNTQAVCLPSDMRFPDFVKRVRVRNKGGNE